MDLGSGEKKVAGSTGGHLDDDFMNQFGTHQSSGAGAPDHFEETLTSYSSVKTTTVEDSQGIKETTYNMEGSITSMGNNQPGIMQSSLDEIGQPKFYESEDSSSNKTDNKNISTSQILEDDFDLPHDSLDAHQQNVLDTTYSKSSHPFDSSPKKGEGISAMKSPFDLGPDDDNDSLDEPLPPKFTSTTAASELHFAPSLAEESKFTSFKPSDDLDDFGMGIHKSKPMEFNPSSAPPYQGGDLLGEKNPSPVPGYQLDDLNDDMMVRKFDQQHSELSSFLKDSAREFPPSPIDDFDRSDNSVSPNPTQFQGKAADEQAKPFAQGVRQDFNLSSSPAKTFGSQPDSGDYYEKEYEVVPPIPSHKNLPDYTSAGTGGFGKQSEPVAPVKQDIFKKEPEKPKEVPKPKIKEDPMAEFLPIGKLESATTFTPKKKEGTTFAAKGPDFHVSKEVQQILNIVNPAAWFDPAKLHPTVSELVYWRDPKKSGVVFGSIFLVLVALTFLSFISVLAYVSLVVLTGTFAFRVYKNILQAIQKTNDGHPFKEYLEADLSLQSDRSEEVYKAIVNYLNAAVLRLRHYFLVEDIMDSVKFAAALYMLTYVGSWFNGLTLLILGFLALFGLPKVYETNKTIIDQYLDLAWAKISEVNAKVSEVIPWGKKEKAQ